ncbi:hypothetical protein K439DRAFT_1630799 [Ramaria rubella]|nr:hypothetical protein K439DRAFT_1630799 [Ramaria rubella]
MSLFPYHDEDCELNVSAKGGNWGNKLHDGARWVRKGKLAAWTPLREGWEVEERARKRIKRMMPPLERSPSPPRFSHLRSPSPPLLAPYAPPTIQHLSFMSLVLDPAAQHSFRSGTLGDLERATCGLIEGEAALRRAMGRLWEVLSDDPETRAKVVEERRSATVPKKEDIDGEDGLSERDEGSERASTAPEMASNLHRIFINLHDDEVGSHVERVLPPFYDPTNPMVPLQQDEILDKGLATLRELQEDGRAYVERLEEIREGLGWVRSQKKSLWTVIRERALKEMEEGEML